MSTTVHSFPDANVFLHFAALDGLDWCGLCRAEEVIIHITQPLLVELNKVKELGPTKAIRKRAATVQRRLAQLLDTRGSTAQLAANVKIVFEGESPDLSDYRGLNPNVSDDVLLAAMLGFCARTKETAVLVTDDNGLGLVVKAAKWKVAVLRPLDSARLPDEPDEEKKEIERLRQRVVKLESAMPSLKLLFGNRKDNLLVTTQVSDIDAELAVVVAKEKDNHRPLPIPTHPTPVDRLTVGAAAALGTNYSERLRNDPDEVARYNSALEQYFVEFETAARSNLEIKSRTVKLDLELENSGSAPAGDVLAHMHFPDGMKVLEKREWTELLVDLPELPDLPGTFRGYRHLFDNSLSYLPNIRPVNIHAPSLSIRQTNSFEVEWHLPKLRQEHVSQIDPIFVVYDRSPFSFQMDYGIVADNLPETAVGKLHVVVP